MTDEEKKPGMEYSISWHSDPMNGKYDFQFQDVVKKSLHRHVNDLAKDGWRLHSITTDSQGNFVIAMEKEREGK